MLTHLKPLRRLDVVLFAMIVVFCYFALQQGDIWATGSGSITYLNGHILDFYDYNLKAIGEFNYLPPTFILFALWNIPIRLLGIIKDVPSTAYTAVFWFKLLPTIVLGASAIVLYKIGELIGLSKQNAKLMTAFWISTPLLIFSQFMFGQYDIFTVFLTLLGLYFYLRREMRWFVVSFAFSLTFKYFPAMIFVPLLLLVEKRPMKILSACIALVIPAALVSLPYLNSSAFRDGVIGFQTNNRIFAAVISAGSFTRIEIIPCLWLMICAWAFWRKFEFNRQWMEWSLYLCLVVSALLFSFMSSNPQWILFITPFVAITTFINAKPDLFIFLDLAMMYGYIGVAVNAFPNIVDQQLWHFGVFGKWAVNNPVIKMKDLLVTTDTGLLFTVFATALLVNVLLKAPIKRLGAWVYDSDLPLVKKWNLVRARFLIGVMIFLIPAAICFWI